MLSVKVVYDENSRKPVEELIQAKGNPMFEILTEDSFKDKKKAWKYKGAAGAKELPFIAVYDNSTLIKAFYHEDGSASSLNFTRWFDEYLLSHAKYGYMSVTKLEGKNNERYQPGAKHEGFARNGFIEGISLLLDSGARYFRTSPIKSIDWENHTFQTCNSTYSFTLNEET